MRRPYAYVPFGHPRAFDIGSRHIIGLWVIDGLLRDVGAREPWRLRRSIFALRRHKHIVLVLVVHDAL